MIRAAIDYAGANGAKIIEAFPLNPEMVQLLPYERYMGIESTFKRIGFQVVARRSDRRPVMRYYL